MSQREKNNNNVCQFVQKCKNSMFVIFIRLVKILNLFNLLLSTRKSVAEKKKRHLSFKIICKIWTKPLAYIAKLNLFFMKPNNLTSLRRMSRVRFAWPGFLRSKLTIFSIHTVLHPYSALSLIDGALGKTLPCRPHFTQIRF